MKSTARAQELKFLALTFALVVCLGAGSLVNMVKAPQVMLAKNAAVGSRLPASVPSGLPGEKPASALSNLDTLEWSCGDAGKNMEVNSNRLRVKGRACGKQLQGLVITNLTNGLVATVFNGERGYTTEYMDLNPGRNELKATWKNKKGQEQSAKFTIIRN